jgi:hypothetical protein
VACFVKNLVENEKMRRSLRKTHRIIWFSFVIALPAVIAIAWNVAPFVTQKPDQLLTAERSKQQPVKGRTACTYAPRYEAKTEVASYHLENAQCSDNVQIVLNAVVRVPQLAIYLAPDSIAEASIVSLRPLAFFDGSSHLVLEVPKSMLDSHFFILLADDVRNQPVDQVKMIIK